MSYRRQHPVHTLRIWEAVTCRENKAANLMPLADFTRLRKPDSPLFVDFDRAQSNSRADVAALSTCSLQGYRGRDTSLVAAGNIFP
jgi:hypothetical protein